MWVGKAKNIFDLENQPFKRMVKKNYLVTKIRFFFSLEYERVFFIRTNDLVQIKLRTI